ncbi:Ovule protein [Pseudomonas chlororaphis]
MASYLCLKSSDRPPTQGPHHYSEINPNVNLPKVLPQKALTALFPRNSPPFTPFIRLTQ